MGILSEVEVLLERDPEDRAEITSLDNCTILSCSFFGILSNVNVTKTHSGCKFCEKCVFRLKEVDIQPQKKPKNKVQNSTQSGCVFQGFELPKSKSILQKVTNPWDRSAACDSQKIHYATSEFRKEMVHRKV